MARGEDKLRIAIVGSGAAAAGVLLAIPQRFPDRDITIVERQREGGGRNTATGHPSDLAHLHEQYAFLRAQTGRKFPPPKTHFGVLCPRLSVENGQSVWESRERGGLTNYWGGSALLFTDNDFKNWPFSLADLMPFYSMSADAIGISGEPDNLSSIFEFESLNRPPIRTTETVDRLIGAVNGSTAQFGFDIRAGKARLAIETREHHVHACSYSGNCMIGCAQQSVYSAGTTIETFIRSGARVVGGKVIAFDAAARYLTVGDEKSGRHEQVGPFDLIFLAAGCIGTAEIVLRSSPVQESTSFRDNAVASFPIFYTGPLRERAEARYIALANAILAGISQDGAVPAFSVQIYPIMDHLWRYLVPASMWGSFEPMGRQLRRRLLIGRLYLHSDYGPRYSLSVDRGKSPWIRLENGRTDQPGVWKSLRATLNRRGFYVPPLRPAAQHTSSHYSGSLPYGAAGPTPSGEIAPGIFVCDPSVFPDAPAWSPTLTIIANAMRTVYAAAGQDRDV